MAHRSACLIFNPISGSGNPEQDLERIQALLSPQIDLTVLEFSEDKDICDLAEEAIASQCDIIIASGGDGTLNGVASALIDHDIPLGIIPRGTANAFASAMGIPDNLDAACEAILQGNTKQVDLARCNDKPMVLLAGVGLEAAAIERTDTEKKSRFGLLAYVLSGIQELTHLKRFQTEIVTEDSVINVDASSVIVANAAPPTSILAQGPAGLLADDGLLDITIVATEGIADTLAASYQLFQSALRGKAAQHPNIGYLRARTVKISTDPPQTVALDGELLGETPIEIECLPKALTLIVPSAPDDEAEKRLEHMADLNIQPR
ncbi:YegS/Rv2252/BmrU family lipid kinase [Leptolyngbya sp. FACHB-16]|uniref:YegS/Rv2252/BmrU family lipid kinase n=1 Tax=unclassified Leptolyngbya TaxID=2650499 RepID=UPI001687B4FE|nr:YegS/Rv2252/BmrU family lipid kinase [Leptolyngbya sp. FACHB-16]MBD2157401.1 YegS/Rv2252/BmrU family lipid kinase [Leptolyngbya sp. FACHB-16]